MKILLVAHRAPFPPDSGAKIRSFNMIRHLARTGHEVTVASLLRDKSEARQVEGLSQYCSQVILEQIGSKTAIMRMLTRLPTTVPSSMGYFYAPRLKKRIAAALQHQDFDFIIVHSSSVAPYVADVPDIPKLLDFCDMDSQKWLGYVSWKPFPLNLGYWLEGHKLQRSERKLAAQFDVSTVATPAELDSLQEMAAAPAAEWFPNGVDSDLFCRQQRYNPDGPLVFVGRMDYYPNEQAMTDFCAVCWPGLRAGHPDRELHIVGAAPTAAVRALGELPGVRVTGYVDDVRPYLEQASIAIAPLQIARGTQNKVLEAMAMELPVVCSAAAAGGVDAKAGEHLEVATDSAATASLITTLWADPRRAEALGSAARQRVLTAHSWESAMQKMLTIVERHAR